MFDLNLYQKMSMNFEHVKKNVAIKDLTQARISKDLLRMWEQRHWRSMNGAWT